MTLRPALLLPALVAATTLRAATFTVTSEADIVDPMPGNGFCNVFAQPGPGPCTLRAAIIEANALAGPDLIDLQAGQVITLSLEGRGEDGGFTGDLDVTDDLTIRFFASGERPIVDADRIDRAFDLISGTVTLLGFDIVGGDATSPEGTSGGGVLVRSDTDAVTLSLMRLRFNHAQLGGGLYNFGAHTRVVASEFDQNSFVGVFDGYASGAAIRNRGTLDVDHSSFTGNKALPPVRAAGAPLGGVDANTIDNEPQGGDSGLLTIRNSTIAANHGTAVFMAGAGSIELSSTTIAGNTLRGVRIADSTGSLLMHNTIVARNALQDCNFAPDATLDLDRYNLDGDGSCALDGGTSNQVAVDPRLTPPERHGGVTATSWPLVDSPIVDHGHPLFVANGCEDDDQAFADRPIDYDGDGAALCDLGAVELDSDVIFHEPFDRL